MQSSQLRIEVLEHPARELRLCQDVYGLKSDETRLKSTNPLCEELCKSAVKISEKLRAPKQPENRPRNTPRTRGGAAADLMCGGGLVALARRAGCAGDAATALLRHCWKFALFCRFSTCPLTRVPTPSSVALSSAFSAKTCLHFTAARAFSVVYSTADDAACCMHPLLRVLRAHVRACSPFAFSTLHASPKSREKALHPHATLFTCVPTTLLCV